MVNARRCEGAVWTSRTQLCRLYYYCCAVVFCIIASGVSLVVEAQAALSGGKRPSLISGKKVIIKKMPEAPSVPAVNVTKSLKTKSSKKKKHIGARTFSLAKLPLNFKDWELDISRVNPDETKTCVARSKKKEIDDGFGTAFVSFEISRGAVRVLTDSDIDAYQAATGVRVDKTERFFFDRVFSSTNLEFALMSDDIVEKMKKGNQAELILGFWPQQTLSDPISTRISLRGFSLAYRQLQQCERLLAKA